MVEMDWDAVDGAVQAAELAVKGVLVAVNVFVFLLLIVLARRQRREARSEPARDGDALVVIAHPDDECMFFAPTILRLARDGRNVHVLCLSTGNYDGLGSVRRHELEKSCKVLGVNESRVFVVDDKRLRDDPAAKWDLRVVAEHITSYVDRASQGVGGDPAGGISVLVTFDDGGVSGHANHCAVYRAVRSMCSSGQLKGIRSLALETTSLLRKYASFVDVPLSLLLCERVAVSSPASYVRAVRAMRAHASQFVWFRRLYVLFSRYMHVNTLTPIN